MKGFVLKIGGKTISGAVNKGVTGVLISNKEGPFRLNFSSMDDDNASLMWHVSDLDIGDSFSLSYEEIENVSKAEIRKDFRNTSEEDKRLLESYHKLKQELIDEGLISYDN